jgi:hypothetical protein
MQNTKQESNHHTNQKRRMKIKKNTKQESNQHTNQKRRIRNKNQNERNTSSQQLPNVM